MQQVVQGALSLLGLSSQSNKTTLFDTLGLETTSRPLSLSPHNGSVSLLDASLLAWLLLLQREGGEDDRVESFNWGRRSSEDETSTQFSVKSVFGAQGVEQTASVKSVLEALQKVTQDVSDAEDSRTLFFNDAKEVPEKINEQGWETAQRPVSALTSLTQNPRGR